MTDFKFYFFWCVCLFHTSPPKLSVVELEKHSIFTDVEVDNFLFFITFSDNLSWEVNSLINLNTNLRLNSHLSRLVTSPSVQFFISQQGNWITFTWLYFLDGYFLLFLEILEILVFLWQTIIFVLTVSKGSILSITPVIHMTFTVNNSIKLAACCNTFNFLAFESPDLCRLKTSSICTVPQRTSGVHKQIPEHTPIFTAISKWINLPILIQNQSMLIPTNSILNLDIILFKIIY